MNYQKSGNVVVAGNKVIIDGIPLPAAPTDGRCSTIIGDKVYIDGYEFKRGKWRKTLKAWWYKHF